MKEYILNRVSAKKWNDALCIRIIHREPVSEEDVKGAFLRWFEVSGSEMQRDAKKDFVAQICLFIVGIILIALSLFLQDKVNPVHFAIISTLGTFSIWEGASVWIIRSPAHRRRRKIFKRLEEAAYMVGWCTENNYGTKDAALEWYKRAAELGWADAEADIERLSH